ncbi:uncharacterized protein TNCV_1364341 [Trichonephila clavipes]|uniref:Uncharacterized protein n=1 Tax=Trichonephila clavipes TaxID=2585209 RepID=A0A8X6VB39_TRICX|nr:uncharacterized protein TNCV_1364341 [Trichonephila clavipes]
MAASSSTVIPTPLAHADNQGTGHPRRRPYIGAQRNLIYMTPGSSIGEGLRLVSDIRVSVSAEYRNGLCAFKSSVVKSIPCHT